MGLEKSINQILTCRSDFTREQIFEMIKNKKSEAGNFLTDQTAARIVASELGVEISKKKINLKIQIKDIFSGLNDVSVTGKVITFYPVRKFKRKNWTDGKFGSVIVSDETGIVKVVLWDKKAEILEKGKIEQNQTVTISHAYARQGQDGKTELHIGDKGKIKILTETIKKLTEITQEGGPITVEGTVNTKPVHRDVTTSKKKKSESHLLS